VNGVGDEFRQRPPSDDCQGTTLSMAAEMPRLHHSDAIACGGQMAVRMDRAGRVVLPKPVRDELGLYPNIEFDLVVDGVAIRLEPRRRASRQIKDVDGWPVLAAVDDHVLTDDDVRAVRDAGQR
jgi:AbrB family looped-hinge helix DNA binding protein